MTRRQSLKMPSLPSERKATMHMCILAPCFLSLCCLNKRLKFHCVEYVVLTFVPSGSLQNAGNKILTISRSPSRNPTWQGAKTSRRIFYRPHFKYKIVISPQRNVYFRIKKGVSELKGLTFPSRFSSTLFSLAGLVLSTLTLLPHPTPPHPTPPHPICAQHKHWDERAVA